MKERELDYKKSMDQLLKDKDDANRQLKMMQEGEEFDSICPSDLHHHLLGRHVKEYISPVFWMNVGNGFYCTTWCFILMMSH
jgi:hypothetical protein